MKSYEKDLVFLVAKTVYKISQIILSLKLAKVFSQQSMPRFIPVVPSILEPSRHIRNLPPQSTDKEKPYNITK